MLEDILNMYVMDKPFKWKYYLHLIEFAYNNWQQALLGMSPFEALCGRKCRTPITCDNFVNIIVLGPKLLKEMEHEAAKSRHNLKTSQDRQKTYAYKNIVHREFHVGDHFYLRVMPRKISLNLGSCANISQRYC